MGEVVTIGRQETLLDFVNRERVVRTRNAEYRFGWTNAEARKHLQTLADLGLIQRLGPFHPGRSEGGSGYDWVSNNYVRYAVPIQGKDNA